MTTAEAHQHPTQPSSVIKRDGQSSPFDLGRITAAVTRAGAATSEFDGAEAHLLARQVRVRLARRGTSPHVEEIQDAVEHLLIDSGYVRTARAFIVYREQHARLRDTRRNIVDVADSINEYLDRSDWRINANANQGYSLGGLDRAPVGGGLSRWSSVSRRPAWEGWDGSIIAVGVEERHGALG